MNRLLVSLLLLGLSACTQTYAISPRVSGVHYAGAPRAQGLQLVEARKDPAAFTDGRLRVRLKFPEGASELAFLQKSVSDELSARGVAVGASRAPLVQGVVREFGVRNRRVTGFSPLVTYTRFSGDFHDGRQTVRIVAYSKQSKVPVWSMSELGEPCFNRPMNVIVGEIAAKLNRHFVGARASATDVRLLAERARTAAMEDLLVIANALGWSNHPDALAPLLALTSHEMEDVRGAALGALGALGHPQSLAALQRIAKDGASHTDRYMALKSIGDLGTPEALAFLREVRAKDDDDDVQELTALFLDAPASAPLQVSAAGR